MKLVFPHGEHKDITLEGDLYRIGSADTADICLKTTGVADEHAVIRKQGGEYVLEIDNPAHLASVNGKLVQDKKTLREGDLLIISQVHCRVQPHEEKADDPAQTVVRMALPKFVLRGVSGPYFGKTYPLRGKTLFGRHADCDVRINSEGISRRHAEIVVTPDGLLVRDLDSSNGTFVNGERISEQIVNIGDEIRFDALRFLVQNPALPDKPHSGSSDESASTASRGRKPARNAHSKTQASMGKWILTAVVLAAAIGASAWYLGYLTF